MSTNDFHLPQNTELLLPSQHRTAFNHYLDNNVDSLAGIDGETARTISNHAITNNVESRQRMDGDPTLISDLLRVRADETLTLHPFVLHTVEEQYLDLLLEDVVVAYEHNVSRPDGNRRPLHPVPTFPEPVLDALNNPAGLAYQHPQFSISKITFDRYPVIGDDRSSWLPIEVYDILADLRADSIVTSVRGLNDERIDNVKAEGFAARLQSDGRDVHGLAEVSVEHRGSKPTILVDEFGEHSWNVGELIDTVFEARDNHSAEHDIRVKRLR